ncbi:MAG: RibD family protein, partial [Pseudomonadota bacterium]|nr:RibD family protein [Pseudomonadota bacterium]
TVETGLLEREAAELQAGFLLRLRAGRPLFTLKLATSLDGCVATTTGESQWITGPEARRAVHVLRGRHDAVLVGIGTALADDPALTCRLPGFKPIPDLRIVLDTHLRLPLASTLAQTARVAPVWVLHGASPDPARREALLAAGIRLVETPTTSAGLDLAAASVLLGDAGLTRVLVEGGAAIATSLVAAGLADRLAWFHAPCLLDGVSRLADAPRFTRRTSQPVGPDWLTELEAA